MKKNKISLAKTFINPGGVTIWLTGLSGCGKSTIADALAERLQFNGCRPQRIDGDVIRQHLWKELGFSKEDRDENIRRATFLAKLLTDSGIITITTFISPYRELREYARKTIGSFIEVYVKCPIEVCMQRDPKGLYRKALAGEIKNFTGISDPYEEPTHPDVLLESDKETLEECVNKIIAKVDELMSAPLRTIG
jgi:adenylylsulfate kinase